MPESKDSRTICGREYTFVNVVVHASDASKIVLCRDTSGNMRYELWMNGHIRMKELIRMKKLIHPSGRTRMKGRVHQQVPTRQKNCHARESQNLHLSRAIARGMKRSRLLCRSSGAERMFTLKGLWGKEPKLAS
jgi:hypothetical protein